MSTQETYEQSIWRGLSAPFIVTWMIASFLPIFGLMGAAKTPIQYLMEGFFLATGFVGVFGLWFFALFSAGEGDRNPARSFVRGREKAVSVLAMVWLSGYAAYHFLITIPR